MPNLPSNTRIKLALKGNRTELHAGKLGAKWASSEEVSESRLKSSVPPASYFRNRRSSLPANSLSVRPRTSLNDVFTGDMIKKSTDEAVNHSNENISEAVPLQRLKRTATLSQNCRALAELMKARSVAISRLSTEQTNVSDGARQPTNTVNKAPEDKISSNQMIPRPQKPHGERKSRLTTRRGSTPIVTTRKLTVTPEEQRSSSSSPTRKHTNRYYATSVPQKQNTDKDKNMNLGDLLSVKKSGENMSSQERARDIRINLQRRQSIKDFDPAVLVSSNATVNCDNEVPEHVVRRVVWSEVLTTSSPDFSAVKSAAPSSGTVRIGTGRSATPHPCSGRRRTDEEIAEQVEAELKLRVADRRRQLRNMVQSGRRLNALQTLGPRAHQSTKMLQHLPGSRLRKVMAEIDHHRTTNELIEVRIETLKVSVRV